MIKQNVGRNYACYKNMGNFYVFNLAKENLAPPVREISWSKNIVIMEKCKDGEYR